MGEERSQRRVKFSDINTFAGLKIINRRECLFRDWRVRRMSSSECIGERNARFRAIP